MYSLLSDSQQPRQRRVVRVVSLVRCGAVGAASEGWTSNMESRHRGSGLPGGLTQRAEGSDGQLLDVQRIHVSPKSLFFWQLNETT